MRVKLDFTTSDAYKIWKKQNPTLSDKISYKTYKGLIGDVNNAAINDMYTNLDGIKFPFGFGTINIIKKKMVITDDAKYLRPNWALTRKFKKIIYHLNDHSNGYKMRWNWDRTISKYKHKKLFIFDAIRRHDRDLAKLILNNHQEFYIQASKVY